MLQREIPVLFNFGRILERLYLNAQSGCEKFNYEASIEYAQAFAETLKFHLPRKMYAHIQQVATLGNQEQKQVLLIEEKMHTIFGQLENEMCVHDPYQYITLGRMLERAMLQSKLASSLLEESKLAIRTEHTEQNPTDMLHTALDILEKMDGNQVFLMSGKTYRLEGVLHFIVLDPHFSKSVHASVRSAFEAMCKIIAQQPMRDAESAHTQLMQFLALLGDLTQQAEPPALQEHIMQLTEKLISIFDALECTFLETPHHKNIHSIGYHQ